MKSHATDDDKCPLVLELEMGLHGRPTRPHVTDASHSADRQRARSTGHRDPAARWRLFERGAMF